MKSSRIHLCYCAIILIMGFSLWNLYDEKTIANGLLSDANQILARSNVVSDEKVFSLIVETDNIVRAYATTHILRVQEDAHNIQVPYQHVIGEIEAIKEQLMRCCGTTESMENISSPNDMRKVGSSFFKDTTFTRLQAYMLAYDKAVSGALDSTLLNEIDDISPIRFLNDKPIFNIRFERLSANAVLLQLNLLLRQFTHNHIRYLEKNMSKFGSVHNLVTDNPQMSIIPMEGSILAGDTFHAYIMVHGVYQLPASATLLLNNKAIDIVGGMAKISQKENSVGKKEIAAQLSLKNPLTGELKTLFASYEYHVLPKCSTDCQ